MTIETKHKVDLDEALADTEIHLPPDNSSQSRIMELYTSRLQPREPERGRVIGCVIPAYNEEDSIGQVLESLLNQTILPDVVHVIINNTTDETFYVAREFAGEHRRKVRDEEMTCRIHIHDVGKLPSRKVGALNIGFSLIEDECDYFLGVDGDTTLAKDCIERLFEEAHSDPRIGGISAIYSIDYDEGRGEMQKWLISGQRQQFASFNMLNLLRGRNMAVLGGQCSLFSVSALQNVRDQYRQLGPWVTDSEVEDSLLSLQLKKCGYATKISASARADVGAMVTLKSLDAQQVKWNYGAIDLMWPGQRGNTAGQPLHPNMRLRWIENFSMFNNVAVRVLFVLLLAASLSINAFVFNPIWLIPPAVAIALNVRTALSMKGRTWRDVVFALLFFPSEFYLWLKMGHFLRSWVKFLSREEVDNWAAQAAAEKGKANNVYIMPLVWALAMFVTLAVLWVQMPLLIKQSALWLGWPLLVLLTVTQTLGMLFRLLRKHRGFRV